MPNPLSVSLSSGGLYAITDGPRSDLLERAQATLAAGATVLQYRDKTGDRSRRQDEAIALRKLCDRHRVPLIINDDVELCVASAAAGVHLGEHDADLDSARAQLGAGALIGISCYDSLERARVAAAAGADYLAFGAFFTSPTKPHARATPPEILRSAKAFGLPIVAIGGITPRNGRSLIDAGADFLAVVSGIFSAADAGIAAAEYTKLFRHERAPNPADQRMPRVLPD